MTITFFYQCPAHDWLAKEAGFALRWIFSRPPDGCPSWERRHNLEDAEFFLFGSFDLFLFHAFDLPFSFWLDRSLGAFAFDCSDTASGKQRTVALLKSSHADACPLMSGNRRQVAVGLKEGDMSKISGQDRESFVSDDALLLAMPLLHLPSPQIGFLLDLFRRFWHDTLLLC
jgi:hypothetical protein